MKILYLSFPLKVLLLLFLLSSGTLYAQNFGGGLVVGFNGSQIDGDNFGGYEKFGASLGGFVTYKISEKLSLQPEILWDQLGSSNVKVGFSNRFNYVTVPIFMKFRVPIKMGRHLYDLNVMAGPSAAVLLNAKDAISQVDITPSFKGYDIRGMLGVTFDVSRRLTIGVRGGYSATSIIKGTSALPSFRPQANAFNNYVNLSFFWHFATY